MRAGRRRRLIPDECFRIVRLGAGACNPIFCASRSFLRRPCTLVHGAVRHFASLKEYSRAAAVYVVGAVNAAGLDDMSGLCRCRVLQHVRTAGRVILYYRRFRLSSAMSLAGAARGGPYDRQVEWAAGCWRRILWRRDLHGERWWLQIMYLGCLTA